MTTGLWVNSILPARQGTFPHQETLITHVKGQCTAINPSHLQPGIIFFLVSLYSYFERMLTSLILQPHISILHIHNLHKLSYLTATKS